MKNLEGLKRNHFKTPVGYFEQLPGRVLGRIEEQQERQPTKVVGLHGKGGRYIVIAASVMALFTLGSVYNAVQRQETRTTEHQAKVAQQSSLPTDALEIAADYTMCDNDDIFAFLMDE